MSFAKAYALLQELEGLPNMGINRVRWEKFWNDREIDPPAWPPEEPSRTHYVKEAYWLPSGAYRLAEPIDAMFFQVYYHIGPEAVRILQSAVQVWPVDGIFGPLTLSQIERFSTDEVVSGIAGAQTAWYVVCDGSNPDLQGFCDRARRAKAACS